MESRKKQRSLQVELELEKKISTFSQLGMRHPIKIMQPDQVNMDFLGEVYPASRKTSRCVFVPSRKLIRTMIKALAVFGSREKSGKFFLRFRL